MPSFIKTTAFAAAVLCLGAVSLPGWATSSAASSASESVGASVGSLSNSIQGSSRSSTGGNNVAAGDYKILGVTPVMAELGKPALARLTLQALAAPQGQSAEERAQFDLLLPQAALAQSGLSAGGTVTAREHAYGIEFANAANQQAFFLVLQDAWFKEIQSHPVTL
ncbi:hypothetical protein [Roseateles koreensis]|uniref:DUF4426 domain-containing protein n=1 Tax=Roseateles koreensis TaxID=2987526 RepID=A0ABT5KMR4_9BURK|nr:hypothetical protein [Roseateles koreensis]MDC8784203.1 hypothetical protein [Roseateles koreensis]